MLKTKTLPDNRTDYVDVVQDTGNTDYLLDGVIYKNAPTKAVMVTEESDLADLTGYDPGSVAYTAGFKAMWQLSADGTWESII